MFSYSISDCSLILEITFYILPSAGPPIFILFTLLHNLHNRLSYTVVLAMQALDYVYTKTFSPVNTIS